jgi:hypothetical protein
LLSWGLSAIMVLSLCLILSNWVGMIFPVNQASRPKQRPGFELEMLNGEVLLYHVASTRIFALNQTASLIWQLCGGRYTVEEIIEVLGNAYPDSADDIPAQVEATLAQFLKRGVIDLA